MSEPSAVDQVITEPPACEACGRPTRALEKEIPPGHRFVEAWICDNNSCAGRGTGIHANPPHDPYPRPQEQVTEA